MPEEVGLMKMEGMKMSDVIGDKLYNMSVRHDHMEYTSNEQFELADELLSLAELLLAERDLLLAVVDAVSDYRAARLAESGAAVAEMDLYSALDAYNASKGDSDE